MTFSPRTETYVNVSSLTTPFNITVTKPTGTVDGDILFCWIGWYAAVTIDSVPSGWNLLGEYIANTDRYALYYKIASGEGASWIWSFTATAKVRAVCSCYTKGDFDPSNPIDVVSNTAYRTSDLIVRAATMTVATVNSPLVFWGGFYATSTKSFAKPSVPTSGWVEDDDVWNTTPDIGTEVCSFIWSGSGATGAMDATLSVTATSLKHAFAVALKPPSVTAKAFADVGGGAEGFTNPFRAMGFGETGHGTEGFNNPFRAMPFADAGAGADAFTNPFRSMGFNDAASGADAFIKEILVEIIEKYFSDSSLGSVSFINPYRAMGFLDTGLGTDVFGLLCELAFSDFGSGSDVFVKEIMEIIWKSFIDGGLGTDVFAKEPFTETPHIGYWTTQFNNVYGTRHINSFLEDFNKVMGDWQIGDYPP